MPCNRLAWPVCSLQQLLPTTGTCREADLCPQGAKDRLCPGSMSDPAGTLFLPAPLQTRQAIEPGLLQCPALRTSTGKDFCPSWIFPKKIDSFSSFQVTILFGQASGDHICLCGEGEGLFPVSPRHHCMQSGIWELLQGVLN